MIQNLLECKKAKKTIIIRANSSSTIGTGHVKRSLVLAKRYAKKGFCVTFAVEDLQGNINDEILKNSFCLHVLKSNKEEELIKLIKNLKPKLLIIDIYDKIDEKKIKNQTGVKLLCFDDTFKKHYCDILLNHNIYAKKSHYKGKVPPFCKIKCGKKYTLLRDEFLLENKKRRKKQGVLVCLGGNDATNQSLKIAKKIPKKYKIKIATTSANIHLTKLKQYAKKHKNVSLFVNQNIAKLLNESEFAFLSASTLSVEALFLKTPFAALEVAKNQKYMAKYLRKKGFLCKKSFSKKEIKRALNAIDF